MRILAHMLVPGCLHPAPVAMHTVGIPRGALLRCSSSITNSSLPKTQQTKSSFTEDMQTVAAGRLQLLRVRPMDMAFKLKGVTFDNKQQLIQQLQPGQGVIFCKEPSNPADSNAVAVYTAGMQQLGYIPKHAAAQHWPLQTCFGRVLSVGAGAEGKTPWGATVQCMPLVQNLCMDLLPDSWQQQAEQALQQDSNTWAALQQHVMEQQYKSRCALTGTDAFTRQLIPQWRFDYIQTRVQLATLIPICQPLYDLSKDLAAVADQLAHLAPVLQLLHTAAAGGSGLGPAAAQSTAGREQPQQEQQHEEDPMTNSEVEAMHAAHASAAAAAVAELASEQQQAVNWLGVFTQWRMVDVVRYLAYAGSRRQSMLQEGWVFVTPDAAELLRTLRSRKPKTAAVAAAL